MVRKIILMLLLLVGSANAITFVDTVRASLDDAFIGNGTVYNPTTNYVIMTSNYGEINGGNPVGLRFTSVNVAQGSTIDSAFLQFEAYQDDTAGTVRGSISGENTTNSLTFSDSTSFASRFSNKTTASDSFRISEDWATVGNRYYLSDGANKVDLKHIVEEITGNGAWSSGGSITFLLNVRNSAENVFRIFRQYDYAFASAPILYIYYTAGGSAVSASVSVTDTGSSFITLSADLSGGSGTYDSVIFYWSSTRANVVDLSAKESTYTAASDPKTMTMSNLAVNTTYYFRVKAFDGYPTNAGDTTAIDSVTTLLVSPLTSCAVDSVYSDSSGEYDLMRFRWTAPTQTADTILVAYRSGTGYPSASQGSNFKLPYDDVTDSALVTIQGVEPYTAYFSAWVISGSDTSTVVHVAKSFGTRPSKWVRH